MLSTQRSRDEGGSNVATVTKATPTVAAALPRPPLHTILMSDPGGGKSTLAATYPKPMKVMMFDPFGKDMPYLKRGTPGPLSYYPDGTPFRDVYSLRNPETVLIRLEYYIDTNPKTPDAYRRFLTGMATFYDEAKLGMWKTIVVDSVTFMELAARLEEKYVKNPRAKDPRQWWGGSTDSLEEILMVSLGSMPINVVLNMHIEYDKDEVNGAMLRTPRAPGRLGKGSGVPAGYGEVYHCYVGEGDGGQKFWAVQTKSDRIWNCNTAIDAPDPSEPDYARLWVNWK